MAAKDATLPLQVFISYAREDCTMARRLYVDLQKAGVKPWLDEENLLPGQRWKSEIPQAIRKSAYLIAVLSSHSISKQGFVQKELKIALDVVEQLPTNQVFVIPVRLDDCEPQDEWLQELHRVDLFPPDQYEKGLERILRVLTSVLSSPAKDEEETLRIHSEKQSFAAPPQPVRQQKQQKTETTRKTPVISLRSEPLQHPVSDKQAPEVFKINGVPGRPLEYIQNEYEDQGEVVVDHATGLMWQKSGSENVLTYQKAQDYIDQLNRKRFAGYEDWRLPTIPELMSLFEPEEKNGDLYIDPVFDSTQSWCWSADVRQTKGEGSSGSAWLVGFYLGLVRWYTLRNDYYVRAVRSRQ